MTPITDSLGVIVLNPESDPSSLRITVKTVRDNFPTATIQCAVGKKHYDLAELQRHCQVTVGGDTITSLIDAGLKANKKKWSFILSSGTFLRHYSLRKYECFCKNEKDILFPVVDRKWTFDEATINGLLMPTQVHKDVGPLGDGNHDIHLVKLLWWLDAHAKGYKFKALVGARLT